MRMIRRTPPLLAVLTVLVLAAAALTGYLATRPSPETVRPMMAESGDYRAGTVPGAGGAVEAAVEALPVALSTDYRDLEAGLAEATSLMTASFAEEFRSTFDASARGLARQRKSVTEAHVRAAGLVRADGDRATCLLYVDQVLVSSRTMKNRAQPVSVSQTRVLVDLEKVGRVWKVDGIEPV